MTMTDDPDPEIHAKRNTAAYADAINKLRVGSDLSESEMDRLGLEAVEAAVWGHDFKRDRAGNPIPQGIGAPFHETSNHFAAIRRWQGEKHWEIAVREIWGRDPTRAAKLRLPKLPPEKTT
jgi:hypothetical protein